MVQAEASVGPVSEVLEQNEHKTALRARARRLGTLIEVNCVIRNQELSKDRPGCFESDRVERRSS